jgi:hypothetical protein
MANSKVTLRTAALLDASADGTAQDNPYARGAIVNIVTTSKVSAASLTVKLQGKHNGNGWYDIPGAVTAAITTEATTTLVVAPGVAATANVSVPQHLPRTWRAVYTIAGGTFVVAAYADLLT